MLVSRMARRDVLVALALGAGGLACGPTAARARARAPSRGRVRTTPETSFAIATDYPAIAPFGDDVYVRRRARARELTRAAKADVLVATCGTANFAYLAGGDFGR